MHCATAKWEVKYNRLKGVHLMAANPMLFVSFYVDLYRMKTLLYHLIAIGVVNATKYSLLTE